MSLKNTRQDTSNEASRQAAVARDRRRSPREGCTATAWLSAEATTKGKTQQVEVIDLSLHGVGFQSNESVEPGATHWIVIGAGGLRASSRIRIVTCREIENGVFDTGAEFY